MKTTRKIVDIGLSIYLFAMVMCIILVFSGVLKANDPLPPALKSDPLPPPCVKSYVSHMSTSFPEVRSPAPKGWQWELLEGKWWLVKNEIPDMETGPGVIGTKPITLPLRPITPIQEVVGTRPFVKREVTTHLTTVPIVGTPNIASPAITVTGPTIIRARPVLRLGGTGVGCGPSG